MATRVIFLDELSKLDTFVNDDNFLFIEISAEEDPTQGRFITLDLEDSQLLIKQLTECISIMKQNQKPNE